MLDPTPGVEITAGCGVAVSVMMMLWPAAMSPRLVHVRVRRSEEIVVGSVAVGGAPATLTRAELAS